MTTYERNYGFPEGAPQKICGKTEFSATTTADDGTTLTVIDEATHKVDKYYIAYKGYWNEV